MHPTQHSTHLKPPFPRAADRSTLNPTVQQRAISQLVKQSAETLFNKGSRPHTKLRVLPARSASLSDAGGHVEHSTGEAA